MEIKLTKKQYQTLAKTVILGNWLANASRTEPLKEFDDIQDYILSYAVQFGFSDLIEEEKDTGAVHPTQEFEDSLSPFIDEYNQDNFWEELIYGLAYRDLRDELGDDEFSNIERDKLLDKLQPYMQKYAAEFEDNGIANLRM